MTTSKETLTKYRRTFHDGQEVEYRTATNSTWRIGILVWETRFGLGFWRVKHMESDTGLRLDYIMGMRPHDHQ